MDKMPGRSEHGQNLLRRKVQRKGTSVLLGSFKTEKFKIQNPDNKTILD
jgi:hypothetical protein